jgi:hypothetical protein
MIDCILAGFVGVFILTGVFLILGIVITALALDDHLKD